MFGISFIVTGLSLVPVCAYAIVWIRRRRYTKERFAFATLSALVSLALFLFVLAIESTTPWHILTSVMYELIIGTPFVSPDLGFADYTLLLIVYAFVALSAIYMFKNWDGRRSVSQHEMEQRQQEMSLPKEAWKELLRIVHNEQLALYDPKPYKPTLRLGVLREYVSWKDRARDLVQLKWSYFFFPLDNGWHEEAGCWVGRNVNTGSLVLLRCTPDVLNRTQLTSFVDYAEKLKSDHNEQEPDLIVAIENDGTAGISNLPGIRIQTEKMLLDELITWTDYFTDIRKRMCVSQLPDSDYTVSDVFVKPHFTPDGWALDGPDELEDYLQQWLEEPGQRQLALLGDYGQGKSTAALAFVNSCVQRDDPARIPILIELRGTSPRNMTPLQLLAGWSSQYNINPKALLYMHMTGRLLLIFEGFDEMALVGDTEMRIKHFKTLWEFCAPNAKILITGRPNFFFDQDEMSVSLGIKEPVAGKPYCHAMRLRSFNLDQVRQALRMHDSALRKEICTFAESNTHFMELISRPSLLHIVSVLWYREKLSKKLNKLTSAYVMSRFIRHSYLRQGIKENSSPEFMILTSAERHYFMQGVATYMATNRRPNQITGADLNDVVASLIYSIPDTVSETLSAMENAPRLPLARRISESEYGLDQVQTDVRTCGILIDDPATPGSFRFGHKSFMEFLFAEVVASQVLEAESHVSLSILSVCRATAADISQLPVSVSFLADILGAESNGSRVPKSDQRLFAKRIFFMLIGGKTLLGNVFGRYQLFRETIVRSSVQLPRLLRPIPFLFDPLFIAYTLFLVMSLVLFGMLEGARLYLSLSSVWFGLMMLGFTLVLRLGRARARSAYRIWNRLCKDLRFNDEVLRQIAMINWLPWTGKRAFDYFLDPERVAVVSEDRA